MKYQIFTHIALVISIISLATAPTVKAISDPRTTPNNRIGVHIIDENDIPSAANLVNNQGDWGYVTIVIRQDDKNQKKWQAIFDKLRAAHLIPIVRLATHPDKDVWVKPQIEQAQDWATFLNSLNWVTQNRYVIIFNEPNHAKEWGNHIDPREYAKVLSAFSQALKQTSSEFFILPAGLDTSAPNSINTMDASKFWLNMSQEVPDIFQKIDGWTSHSYPNPAFQGSVTATGRTSIRNYEWELAQISKLSAPNNLPIFITETGWLHQGGQRPDTSLITTKEAANRYQQAFQKVWTSKDIVAITPFVLNYTTPPFDHFSLTDPNTNTPNEIYESIRNMSKDHGKPAQKTQAISTQKFMPTTIPTDTTIAVALRYTNIGQTIWAAGETTITATSSSLIVRSEGTPITEPFKEAKVWLSITTPSQPGEYQLTTNITHEGVAIAPEESYTIQVTKSKSLLTTFKLFIEQVIHNQDLVVALIKFMSKNPVA